MIPEELVKRRIADRLVNYVFFVPRGHVSSTQIVASHSNIAKMVIPTGIEYHAAFTGLEAQRTFNAKSEDGAGIATGDFIEVVDTIGEVLVVKRI